MPKSSKRLFLIRVAGVDGFFATRTGGETTADVGKAWDGGSLVPDLMSAPAETSDVVVTRPYDPARDAPIARRLRPLVGRLRTVITSTPTDSDLVPIAEPTTYNAVLRGCSDPEADAASGDPAVLQLTFAVSTVV